MGKTTSGCCGKAKHQHTTKGSGQDAFYRRTAGRSMALWSDGNQSGSASAANMEHVPAKSRCRKPYKRAKRRFWYGWLLYERILCYRKCISVGNDSIQSYQSL